MAYRSVFRPALFEGQTIVPAESVYAAFEAKQTVNAALVPGPVLLIDKIFLYGVRTTWHFPVTFPSPRLTVCSRSRPLVPSRSSYSSCMIGHVTAQTRTKSYLLSPSGRGGSSSPAIIAPSLIHWYIPQGRLSTFVHVRKPYGSEHSELSSQLSPASFVVSTTRTFRIFLVGRGTS